MRDTRPGVWAALWVVVVQLCCLPAYAADAIPFGRGLLFRVQPPGGPVSHLFATIHTEDPRVLELPPAVRDALGATDTFAMEVLPDATALLTSMLSMVYTDGRTLKQVLGAGLYLETVAAVERIGLPEAAVREFKPWAVVTLLSLPPGHNGEILDLYLHRLAQKEGKALVGLETIDEQLNVFDRLSEADQVQLLKDTLEMQEQLPGIFQQLLGAYLDRDLAGLVRLSERYFQGGNEALAQRFQERAVDARNRRMVERMLPLLRSDRSFIAVGALHLPGRNGILSLLQERGISVEKVY